MRIIWLELLVFSIILGYSRLIQGRRQDTVMKFTNVECESHDKSFDSFARCDLKVLKRGIIALNVHVSLLQLPVNNVSMNIALWKKASGYRPFLYNNTFDYCEFMKNRSRLPFAKILTDMVFIYGNFNFKCPIDRDIIIKNFVLDENLFAKLPLPSGDYLINLKVGAYNRWMATVKIYFMRNEGF